MNLEFLEGFSKNLQISDFLKIRSVQAVVLHPGVKTDRYE